MLQDNINVFSKKELCFSYNAKYFAQRFNRPFDKNGNIRILTVFFTHRGRFWAKNGVIGVSWREFWAQMFHQHC